MKAGEQLPGVQSIGCEKRQPGARARLRGAFRDTDHLQRDRTGSWALAQ